MGSLFFLILGMLSFFFFTFSKKLLCLLYLEMAMILLICLFFFSGSVFLGFNSCSYIFVFLCFMVLESVFGISYLICSSRCGSSLLFSKLSV